ncbi:PKD domain-containing protein [Dyella acidiphila]|uniref:PKD domain-containing protein n=1 Tax=Dyella acidiphila TaxID=2775866 RepID=A0ABR9G5S4_9GAMM|nr:PKD domain-containing protein [Dyella acidiphila]MBE1159394.1 PKD domain-containing protein [Dyella acidiphila]
MPSNLRVKTLITAMGLALLGSSVGVVAQPVANDAIAAAASSAMVALHPAVSLRNGDQAVGPLAVSQPMHVVITLKLRNEDQLNQYIAKPGFKPLTSAQFNAKYAPTAAQAQSVADYLTKAGFSNVSIAPNNGLVEADGRADTAQAAFHTNFVHVKTHDGRDAFANSSAVQIPANLQGVVNAVLGVQNVHTAHVFARYQDPIAAHAMATHPEASGTAVGHQPSNFPTIYGASGMANITSVAVGSVSAGSLSNVESDLKSVDPGVTVTVKGSSGTSTSGDGEWDLDSQDIIAFTGVKQYYFYNAASLSDADLQTDYAKIVSDNLLQAIDVSLGECETDANSSGEAASNDTTFKQAVAQGQTFFVSAGDSGADECGNGGVTPSWPASSQYVTAVGGTELYTSGTTTWSSETVWNNLSENEGATGGSPSTFEPIPSWQKGVSGVTNQTYRGVPDIAFDASPDSGALVTVDGQANQQIGGTSLAAPLAVGFWAHVLQANGNSVGFAAPVIYKVAQSSSTNYANAFHDVTSGNNSGETAAAGWDYTTGWGSVNVSQFSTLAGGGSSGGSPVANFTDTVSGLTVNFTNTSTDSGGTISSYAWNFGDGSTSTSASPSHTYTAAGTYTVSLQVTDSTGATNTKTGSVTVSSGGSGGSPVASFTDSVSGLSVAFTNTSTDTGGTISSYAWNFGDGSSSTTASPSHTYTAAGTYTVSLQVTDNTGASNSTSQSVTVSSGGGSGGTFSNNTPVTIKDDATVTSSIPVTGESGNAPSNLQVHANITHNWSGDLEIIVYAPSGDYAILQQPNYENNGNINKTWTVNASGEKANGTWKLKVIDDDIYGDGGDHGTLNSWSVTF